MKRVGFWDPQKKNNIANFRDVGPVVKTKVKGQLVSIKQERKLLSRLLVVAKSRPEFQVKDAIGDYEFDSTPPSNFQPDGSMIMLSGKSQVVQSIMDLPLPEDANQHSEEDANGVSNLGFEVQIEEAKGYGLTMRPGRHSSVGPIERRQTPGTADE